MPKSKKRKPQGSPARRAASAGSGPVVAKPSLRAALAAKTNLRTYHDIAVVESDQVEAAQRKVEGVRQLQIATMMHDDPAVKARAESLVETAEAERAACFYRIYFRGLGFSEFDALVALHPPRPEDEAKNLAWNEETFDYALLEACAEDADGNPAGLSAEEWADEFADEKKWSAADRRRVLRMARSAQQQTMADAVPKD